jgi:hypothetical protein
LNGENLNCVSTPGIDISISRDLRISSPI